MAFKTTVGVGIGIGIGIDLYEDLAVVEISRFDADSDTDADPEIIVHYPNAVLLRGEEAPVTFYLRVLRSLRG